MRVEIDRCRLLVEGIEGSMRPNEYGLRLTLAFEPGQVFSRQDLLANDWIDDTIVDERTVD